MKVVCLHFWGAHMCHYLEECIVYRFGGLARNILTITSTLVEKQSKTADLVNSHVQMKRCSC